MIRKLKIQLDESDLIKQEEITALQRQTDLTIKNAVIEALKI